MRRTIVVMLVVAICGESLSAEPISAEPISIKARGADDFAAGDITTPVGDELFFDMGATESARLEGWHGAGPRDIWSRTSRYGFLRVPRHTFFDEELAATILHPNRLGVLRDSVLRGGVESAGELVFITRVPRAGPYWIYVTVGSLGASRFDMQVSVDGRVIGSDLSCFGGNRSTPYGPAFMTVKAMVEASSGGVRVGVTVRAQSARDPKVHRASLLAVRLRPVEIQPALASLAETSTLRSAMELEKRLASLDLDVRSEELDIAERLVDLYRRALKDEAGAESHYFYWARDRLESAQRFLLATYEVTSEHRSSHGSRPHLGCWTAYGLMAAIESSEPLYAKALLLRGRVALWSSQGSHRARCLRLARRHFEDLLRAVEHPLAKVYFEGRERDS